jgi:transketolase
VHELDGHDHAALLTALTAPPPRRGRPTAIIAHTIKGKGVSFMEGQLLWHYRNPDAAQLATALAELEVRA